MINVYISQPMIGLSQREIKEERMEAELEVQYALKETVNFTQWLDKAEVLYLCEGWDFSEQCRKDREYAVEHGLEIMYC